MDSLFLLIAGFFVIGPILGVFGFFQGLTTRRRVTSLEKETIAAEELARKLERRLSQLEKQGKPAFQSDEQETKRSEPDTTASKSVAVTSTPPAVKQEKTPSPVTPSVPPAPSMGEFYSRSEEPETDTTASEEDPLPTTDGGAAKPPSSKTPSQAEPETLFALKWLIWFGGLTIALAGVFLVKYSVDAGWLGPAQRIAAAVFMGMGIMAAGEWIRRKPREIGGIVLEGDQVPAALTAAGLLITFAAVYGGYGLYQLYPPLIAFSALVATAGGGVMVSILHGRYGSFVAGLGMLGAYAVPALVSTDSPSALALFGYLAALNIATLSLLRWRGWAWLGWGVLVGAAAWPLLYLGAVPSDPMDYLIMGIYTLVSSAVVAVMMSTGYGRDILETEDIKVWARQGILPPLLVSYIAAIAGAILVVVLAQDAHYSEATVYVALIAAGVFALLSARIWTLFPLALVSVGLVAFLMLGWPVGPLEKIEPDFSDLLPLFPGRSGLFLIAAALSSAFAFVIGTLKLSTSRPGYWTSIATIVPVGLFALAYLKLQPYEHGFLWNAAAFALFILFDVLARWIWKSSTDEGKERALAAVTIAITSAMSLVVTLTFDEAWLTVALAAQVPVLAWIYRRLNLPILRILAGLIACAVLIRLVGNPNVANYPSEGALPLWNWMWYGYGLPAIFFAVAARWFAGDNDIPTDTKITRENWAIVAMQAAWVVLTVMLVTLEIRALMVPEVWHWGAFRLMESSLDVIAWLTIAFVFYLRYPTKPPFVFAWARRVLIIYSGLHLVFVHLLLRNPAIEPIPVGELPLFNLLALAYLAPALLMAAFSWVSMQRDAKARILPLRFTASAALVLVFIYISFEVRHLFHGTVLTSPISAQAAQFELYTYSAAWLIVAAVLIWVGLTRQNRAIRVAGMGLLAIVVAKVFLVDMKELTGIFRVLSFLGLGLSMIGIGYGYQRVMAQASKNDAEE